MTSRAADNLCFLGSLLTSVAIMMTVTVALAWLEIGHATGRIGWALVLVAVVGVLGVLCVAVGKRHVRLNRDRTRD